MKKYQLELVVLSMFVASVLIAGCGEKGNTEGITTKEEFSEQMEKIEETPGGTPADPDLMSEEDGP